MPYEATGSLQDMISPEACALTAREIADAGLDAFQANVRRNTPIDTNPYRDRPGRPRGTLRESIERTPVDRGRTPAGPAYRGRVFTEDDVAPFVEWDTAPHEIRARFAKALRWRDAGGLNFRKAVMHPGTQGQHMFAIGANLTEHELPGIAAPALARWQIMVTRRESTFTDRRSR